MEISFGVCKSARIGNRERGELGVQGQGVAREFVSAARPRVPATPERPRPRRSARRPMRCDPRKRVSETPIAALRVSETGDAQRAQDDHDDRESQLADRESVHGFRQPTTNCPEHVQGLHASGGATLVDDQHVTAAPRAMRGLTMPRVPKIMCLLTRFPPPKKIVLWRHLRTSVTEELLFCIGEAREQRRRRGTCSLLPPFIYASRLFRVRCESANPPRTGAKPGRLLPTRTGTLLSLPERAVDTVHHDRPS